MLTTTKGASLYGKDPKYPRVCVSAAIVNKEGKVLLTKRSEKVWYAGTWCLPGGHVEGGEDWIAAVRKEVLEEVGLKVKNEVLVGIYSDPKLNTLEDKPSGRVNVFVSACFLIRDFEGEVKITDEVSEYGWFSVDKLPTDTIPVEALKCQDSFKPKEFPFVR